MKLKVSEATLEKQTITWLNLQPGVWAIKYQNKGTYNVKLQRHMKLPYGMFRGTPDVLVTMDGGKFFWIEMKDEDGVQSDAQKEFQKKCVDFNVGYYLSRGLEDTKSALSAERLKWTIQSM